MVWQSINRRYDQLLQRSEIRGAILQEEFVEVVFTVFFAPSFSAGILEHKDFQITLIIFGVIGRLFGNVFKNGSDRGTVGDAESCQHFCRLLQIRIFVVDQYI